MFEPPRCPSPKCPMHAIERHAIDAKKAGRFYRFKGYYYPKCRSHRVPRFVCKTCGLGFSRQTFRQDYRDHKPHLNGPLLTLLAQGMGLRQSAFVVKLSRRCAELKARKMSRHLKQLNQNMVDQFPAGCSFQLDEMETFETERRVAPLTLPMLIEQESMFVIDARPAPIRPSGKMTPRRAQAVARRRRREGPRHNQSRKCIRKVLRTGARLCKKLPQPRIDTDEKTAYPRLLRQAFGPNFLQRRFSSKAPRDTSNPLFPINHMNAMARYMTGRLRRRSWLCSKRRGYLWLQLELYRAYKNFVRPRFNTDQSTPAMVLGFCQSRFSPTDLVSWRQDWGWFSPHPIQGHKTIRRVRAEERARGIASFQRPVVKRGYAD